MGGAQFDHFTGTDEQDALAGNRLENAFSQMDAGGGHRDDVGADGRRAAHFLGDRERALEKLVQLRAERAVFFGRTHGIFHLAENLRLADDHRIEAAGHAESVADGFRLVVGIDVGRQFVARNLMVMRQPIDHDIGRFGGTVDFRPIAGGQDRHFADRPVARQVTQRMAQFVGAKRYPLADGERRGMMVDAEGKNHRIGLAHTKWALIITSACDALPRSGSEQKCLLFRR